MYNYANLFQGKLHKNMYKLFPNNFIVISKNKIVLKNLTLSQTPH